MPSPNTPVCMPMMRLSMSAVVLSTGLCCMIGSTVHPASSRRGVSSETFCGDGWQMGLGKCTSAPCGAFRIGCVSSLGVVGNGGGE